MKAWVSITVVLWRMRELKTEGLVYTHRAREARFVRDRAARGRVATS